MSESAPQTGFWAPARRHEIPSETVKIISGIVEQVPDLPSAAHRIIEMTANDDADMEELVRHIAADPILVAKLLQEVNSTYYGMHKKTDNLQLAVVILGFKEVRRITLATCIGKSFSGNSLFDGYQTLEFWEHSYLVSVAAGLFSNPDIPQDHGNLLTFGLLHDIGKFILYAIAMLMKQGTITMPGTGSQPTTEYLLEKEEVLFGVNHAVLAGFLAEQWNLSDRLGAVLSSHHLPSFYGISEVPQDYRRDIAAICVADLVVNRLFGKSGHLPEPHPLFFELLGLKPPLANVITDTVTEELTRARAFLGKSG